MNKPLWTGMLAGMLAFAPAAYAETLSGTITTVDEAGGQFMMTRADTSKNVAVAVKSKALLERLHPGTDVVIDAVPHATGVWTARNLSTTGIRFKAPESVSSGSLTASTPLFQNSLEERLQATRIIPDTTSGIRPPAGVNVNAPREDTQSL